MAKGSVIEYRGKRGKVFRIKYEDADKRQVMETLGPTSDGWTKRKAEQALQDKLSDVRRKQYRKPKAVTFQTYADGWLAKGKQSKDKPWSESTEEVYECVLERLCQTFGPMRLASIRRGHVAAYVAEQSRRYSASTVNRDVGIFFTVMKSARKEELIVSNPAEDADRPRIPDTDWRILQPGEVRRVAKAFKDKQARTIFLTLAITGLRKSELQQLRWRDVSLAEGKLRVVKSKSKAGRRTIALPPLLLEELEAHYTRTVFKGDDERVFCHPKRGTVYSAEMWEPLFAAALKDAGIHDRVRPFHDLRHTAITNRAAAGLSPVVLMYEAGHSSMQITQRYIDLAGVVFAEEAATAERRMLGAVESSTGLSEPEGISAHLNGSDKP